MGNETSGDGDPAEDMEEATPPGRGRVPVITAVATVLALVVGLAAGWVARGGTSEDDDDGGIVAGAEGAPAEEDDKGFEALLADHHYHPPSDGPRDHETRQLLTHQLNTLNEEFVARYPTVAAAEADDWRRSGPFIPGLGAHYSRRGGHTTTIPASLDGDEDEGDEVQVVLIYESLDDDAPLAGFMLVAVGYEDDVTGFAGGGDIWHSHTNVCVVGLDSDGTIEAPFVADLDNVTEEMCTDRGGEFMDVTTDMVHVWSVPGHYSELGLFSEVNPTLTCPDGTYHRVPYDQLESDETTCPS